MYKTKTKHGNDHSFLALSLCFLLDPKVLPCCIADQIVQALVSCWMLKTSDYLLCKTLYILNLHIRSAGLQLPWLYFILIVAQRPAAMTVLNHDFSTSALQPIIVYPHLCARSKLDMRALKSSPPTTLHRFFENEKTKGRTLRPFLKKLPRDHCSSIDLAPCS